MRHPLLVPALLLLAAGCSAEPQSASEKPLKDLPAEKPAEVTPAEAPKPDPVTDVAKAPPTGGLPRVAYYVISDT